MRLLHVDTDVLFLIENDYIASRDLIKISDKVKLQWFLSQSYCNNFDVKIHARVYCRKLNWSRGVKCFHSRRRK